MDLSTVLELFEHLPAYNQMLADMEGGVKQPALALPSSARPPMVASIFLACKRPMLYVTGRVENVPILQEAIETWLPDDQRVTRFPEPTPLPYERGPWSELSRFRRLSVLAELMGSQHPIFPRAAQPLLVVTSARALMQKTLPRRKFVSATTVMRPGLVVELQKLIENWQNAGYASVSVVQSPGQFSQRGGILDIFPVGAPNPIRIELFGNEVESMRTFNPTTQRSSGLDNAPPSSVIVPPAREVRPADLPAIGRHLQSIGETRKSELPGWEDDIPDLVAGNLSPHLEFYLPLVYARPASLFDYLPPNALVLVDDMSELESNAKELYSHADQIANEQVDLPPGYISPLFAWSELSQECSRRVPLVLGSEERHAEPQSANESRKTLADAFMPGPAYGGQVKPFLMQLRFARDAGERTIVVSRQAQRLAELWQEEGDAGQTLGRNGVVPDDSPVELPTEGGVVFLQGSLPGGFTLERPTSPASSSERPGSRILLHVLSDAEIFGWSRPAPRRRSSPRPVAPENYFADISAGHYVVHLDFGVGRFAGLVVRSIGGMQREYLQLNFANSDVLYVPVHHADRLSKWIGPDDRMPTMHRLGEKSWNRTKAKAQKAVDELAEELLELYASRETVPGYAFSRDSHWQAELEASFPYQETEDQLQAIGDVKDDMERPRPMDRLICGDVGYGKTEVALRAAFKSVMDGKQAAILVPTTVLAQQHYNTFSERLRPFPVNVEMLSRFRTQSHQDLIINGLREGQLDIVIGTHRLLSDDVSFKDLGLLVIDEEQRFGVAHKEKLKSLRTEIDVLTMTATPIPRTLYMSLAGVRDISQIDTAPAERLPVQTYVGEADDALLRQAILRELERNGQVFYVHNRVQSIENVLVSLRNLVPEASIAVGHGQLSERSLEDVMLRFVNGEIDVLLSTTIIESGLDIPNANTLIVDRADQFGLSQLYQLRGRVGRGVRRAYAYFLHPPWHRLTKDGRARLEVIDAQTELGAGYTIAMRDLEIRGAGDLLGARQSGHIAAVGFDLYTRLLAQAVKRRKAARDGQQVPVEIPDEVLIDLPLAAHIPSDYVEESSLRLRLYRRMSALSSLVEIDEMAAELADRFGPIPDSVDNLLYQLRIKVLAARANVAAVTTEAGQIRIRMPGIGGPTRTNLQRLLGSKIRVSRTAIWMERGVRPEEWRVSLVQVLEKLESLSQT